MKIKFIDSFPCKMAFKLKLPWLAYTTGPGEQGGAYILSPEEEKKKDELYRVNGFNAFASDKISLMRSLSDIRHQE